MAWVIAVFVVVLLLALIGFCIVNAVRIRRDMNNTVNTFRTRLEQDANSVVDDLLNADQPDDPARSRRESG